MRLAPLGVVAEKLRARSPQVRAVALIHARGHGENARGLATHIAAMLDDEAVAAVAVETLRAIGKGAGDATAVLVGLLDNGLAPEPVQRRALAALEHIAAEAWPALPMLERLYVGPLKREVLKAMAAIAPNAPKVAAHVVEAVFSEDAALAAIAFEALRAGGPVDAAVAQLRLRAFTFSRAKREGAHRALALLARVAPAPVSVLMAELARGSKPPTEPLVRAAAMLPRAMLHAVLQPLAERAQPPSVVTRVEPPPEPPAPLGEDAYPEFPKEEAVSAPGRLEPAADAPPIDGDLSHGLAMLGRSLTARPADLAEGLNTFFQRQQAEQRESPDDASVQGLAAVWAHCLMQQLGWSWKRWIRAGESALVLASPDARQMVFPAAWVRRQLRKKEPTALQQFNGLLSGNVAVEGDEPAALW